MALAIRMILYFVFPMIAAQGLAVYDETAGTITFQIDNLVTVLLGLGGFLGTFAASRIAKAKGGKT